MAGWIVISANWIDQLRIFRCAIEIVLSPPHSDWRAEIDSHPAILSRLRAGQLLLKSAAIIKAPLKTIRKSKMTYLLELTPPGIINDARSSKDQAGWPAFCK
jgi:hypothetical protein